MHEPPFYKRAVLCRHLNEPYCPGQVTHDTTPPVCPMEKAKSGGVVTAGPATEMPAKKGPLVRVITFFARYRGTAAGLPGPDPSLKGVIPDVPTTATGDR